MSNSYIDFWQNAFTDMFDTTSQFEKMNKLFEQSLSSFDELNTLVQKLGYWDMLKPMDQANSMFFKALAPYMKTFGLISIDEYRSLVKKYEELKKHSVDFEKSQEENKKKISELTQSVASEKKKISTREKTIATHKSKLDELKKLSDSLTKDLEKEQNKRLSLEKERDDLKKQLETMKKGAQKKASETA